MLVVPAVAMFSHRIPPAARKAFWRAVSSPLEGCFAWVKSWSADAPAVGEPEAPAVRSPGEVAVPPAPLAATAAMVGEPPTSIGPPADAALPAARRAPVPDPIHLQLAAHGATSIECRPLDGDGETCVASCHVAIDSSGQLLRVFQTAGPGEQAAYRALLDEVAAWRQRTPGAERLGAPPAGAVRR